MNKILLYINIFLLQSYLFRFQILGFPTHLQEVLIIILSFSFLIESIRKKSWPKIPKTPLIFLILSITASLVVQIFDTQYFLRYWRFLIFASILTGLFINILDTEEKQKEGLKILSLGTLFFAIFSLIVNIIGINNASDLRLLGPLDSAVYLGFYLAPFFIYNFTILVQKRTKKQIILTISLGIFLLLTKSIGAILGSAIVSTLFLFKKYNKELLNSIIKKTIFALLIIMTISAVYITKIKPTIETKWSSLDERQQSYITSNYLLNQDKSIILLGIGPNQFQYHYEQNVLVAINNKPLDYTVLQPHNIFYFTIFNYGIIGFLFLILLTFKIVKNLITLKSDSFQFQVSLIVLYFILHGLIDTPFLKNDLLILIILFIELSLFTKSSKQLS